MNKSETIVARATPAGTGGIAIVRISGENAFVIIDRIFLTLPKSFKSHHLYFGRIINPSTGIMIDEVMVSLMKSPNSYTGEDVVEINAHGSPIIVEKIISLILQEGARMAQPGEFTRRAFLNSKMDLARAEAVCDLISAQTEKVEKIALSQLEGVFSKEIDKIKNSFLDLIAELEAELDFPEEEDVDRLGDTKVNQQLTALETRLELLIRNGHKGQIYQEGVKIAIVGKPNVGKSSIFNALLKYERAIVTSHPGTTRDTIEGTIDIMGIPVILIDTAGIRELSGEVEQLGIDRTKKMIEAADITLFVMDNATGVQEEDVEIINLIKDKQLVLIVNKSDLEEKISEKNIRSHFGSGEILRISALENMGLDLLESSIEQAVFQGDSPEVESILVTNARHIDCLNKALENLSHAKESFAGGMSSEAYLVDLKTAVSFLNEIVGESIDDDILDRIFSKFCIGK